MRKSLLSVAAAASLLALPALAQSTANQLSSDPEIRVQQEWQELVAKTNADRHLPAAIGDVAAVKGTSATDATAPGARVAPQQTAPAGHYQSTQDYWQDR
jgi:hypothetical protein